MVGRILEGVMLREVIPGATEVMLCRFDEVLRVAGICSLDKFPGDTGCAALPVVTIRGESNCGA